MNSCSLVQPGVITSRTK